MSYISADDYEDPYPIKTQFTEANCNNDTQCYTGYICSNNVCTQNVENPPPIPFINVLKPMLSNGAIVSVHSQIPNKAGIYKLGQYSSCNTDEDCLSGLWCNANPSGSGNICMPAGIGGMNAKCADDRDCNIGLGCYPSTSGNGMSCQAGSPIIPPQQVIPSNVPAGGACNFAYQCTVPLNCGPSFTCE